MKESTAGGAVAEGHSEHITCFPRRHPLPRSCVAPEVLVAGPWANAHHPPLCPLSGLYTSMSLSGSLQALEWNSKSPQVNKSSRVAFPFCPFLPTIMQMQPQRGQKQHLVVYRIAFMLLTRGDRINVTASLIDAKPPKLWEIGCCGETISLVGEGATCAPPSS